MATPIEAPNAICVKESMSPASQKNQIEGAAQTHNTDRLKRVHPLSLFSSFLPLQSSFEIIKYLLNLGNASPTRD